MNLLHVAQFLEQAGVGSVGKDIFSNFIPATVKKGVLIRQGFGGFKIDPYVPTEREGSLMVISRGPDYLEAEALCKQVVNALEAAAPDALPDILLKVVKARGEPFPYAPSAGGLTEFVVHIDVAYGIV